VDQDRVCEGRAELFDSAVRDRGALLCEEMYDGVASAEVFPGFQCCVTNVPMNEVCDEGVEGRGLADLSALKSKMNAVLGCCRPQGRLGAMEDGGAA